MRELFAIAGKSLIAVSLFTLLLGVVYPFTVTFIAQLLLPKQAAGQLIEQEGKVVGSELLGQQFTQPKYFWGRLSATTPAYNAAASSGSNLSPANPALLAAVNQRIAALHKVDPSNKIAIPIDLVTASASGLDPHISAPAAEYQVMRVAKVRKIKPEDVQVLVGQHTQPPTFGILGAKRVNVLLLNLALDAQYPVVATKEKR